MWITIITAVLGIISTLIAYFTNPQRAKDKLRSQLVDTYQQLEELEYKRDVALQKNDDDALTVITSDIIRLRKVKTSLLQRI